MANPTPAQVRTRQRLEGVIGLFAPALDLLLAAGDRVSRAVGEPDEYYPIRPPGERLELTVPQPADPAPAPGAGADADVELSRGESA